MAFHNPNPETKPPVPSGTKRTPGLQSLVQAEKLMQIAFVLPCSLVIGWGAGWMIDHHFHTRWATIVGLIFGVIAGMVSVIRLALAVGNTPSKGNGG